MVVGLQKKPKVLIFDIGGVCVVSPIGAILKYEKQNGIPQGYINYAISASKPNGSWHRAEKGEMEVNSDWFQNFHADITRESTWKKYHVEKLQRPAPPSIPSIDAEKLYWTMMSTARAPDPYMGPALSKLRASNQFHMVALSNTTKFPDGHPYNEIGEDDVRHNFEIFISSAHVGMRKPNRDIYEHAMKLVREKWPEDDVQVSDVVFLDDIGENLKMGKQMGWNTIKVLLGKSDDAVRQLEEVTGLDLLVTNVSKARL